MTARSTLEASFTETTEIVLPNETNDLGRALGGVVLHWMDLCGAIAAMRFSSHHCVTASMDHVEFKSPIATGEVAVVEGYVFNTGRTSLDVRVDVRAENPRNGDSRETTTSYLTYVAIDEDGTTTEVPELECPTESEAELRDTAIAGREEQLAAVVDRLGLDEVR